MQGMERMKIRYVFYLAFTGIVSTLLMLVPLVADPSDPSWLSRVVVMPARLLAIVFNTRSAHAGALPSTGVQDFFLNLFFFWFIFAVVVLALDALFSLAVTPKREKA